MAFELRINGQKVWSSERQVTRVSMQSARGEIGAAGISPQDGVIDIFVEEVAPGGPVRIDQVEQEQAQYYKDIQEGTQVGSPAYAPADDANKQVQGVASHQTDAAPGGPDVGEEPEKVASFPETTPSGSPRDPVTGEVQTSASPAATDEAQPSEDDTDTTTSGQATVGADAGQTNGGGMPPLNLP